MWKLKGYTVDAFDQTQVVYNIWANTKNDLPSTMKDIGYGTALGFGSTAQTFDDSKEWRWNGTNWVEQTDGQQIEISADDIVYDNTSSGMTATNVQDAIDEIHTTDETQDRALAELHGDSANQQLEINYAINTGAKNFLKFTNDVGYTLTTHGRTFEVLADGGVKITGDTPDSSYADFYVAGTWGNREPILNATEDDNILSLKCSDALQTDNLYIRAVDRRTGSTASTTTARLNQEAEFNFPVTTVLITVQPSVVLPTGGITVYPMIRNKVIRNSTFEPYAPTNRELYETKTNQSETNVIANLGAKNLLEYNGYGTGAENGVTYTINTDGTITVNGTPQGTSPSYIELKLNGNAANVSRFCDGHHILSGCPRGGSDSTYRMYAARGSYSRFDYGEGVLLTNTTLTDVRLVIYIANGYTANNLVFKPMIRRAEIRDTTFEPYAPTNRELYEMILALQNGRSIQSVNSPMTLNLSRNDLNEKLDSNFDLIDSIPEEEEGEQDV